MRDQTLAVELERALRGEEAAAEAHELASLLFAAAAPARFDVPDDEVERALTSARPRPMARRRALRLFLAAAVVVGAGAAFFILRAPGEDVEARALAAVQPTFFVVEEIRPVRPGLFPASEVSGFVDGARGRAHMRISSGAGLAAEVVLREDGSVARWQSAGNTIALAASCGRLPGGCAEALDPLTLYTRTLSDDGATSERVGDTYRLTIRGSRLDEIVVVDAHSYLPRRIEWRQGGRLVSRTRFLALEPQREDPGADTWRLDEHARALVQQYGHSGRPVRVLSQRLGSVGRNDRWLGTAYGGAPARVSIVDLTDGHATRIDYGPLTVWNFGTIVPPPVLQGRSGPAKVFPILGGVAHVYYGAGSTVVAEASLAGRNVAVISREGEKVDAVRALQQLRLRGSP
jgi:hypothetical protein